MAAPTEGVCSRGCWRRWGHSCRAAANWAESFAAAWDKAASWGRAARLDFALEHAIAGEVRPYYYRGRKCGENVRYGNGLTIAVLKLMSPRFGSTEKKGFFGPR